MPKTPVYSVSDQSLSFSHVRAGSQLADEEETGSADLFIWRSALNGQDHNNDANQEQVWGQRRSFYLFIFTQVFIAIMWP